MRDPGFPAHLLFGGSSTSSQERNVPLAVVVESYLNYYAAGSGHSARAKRLDADHFLSFLAHYRGVSKREKLKLGDWDLSSVQRFIDDSLSKGEAPSTVARRLATLKHMGRTISEQIPGFKNPAKEARAPKISLTKPKAIAKNEVKAIERNISKRKSDKDSFIRHRNEMIFYLLLDTGLRADEIRLLKMSQLDESCEWLKSVRTKGRRFRNVYITSKVRSRLKTYLRQREAELKRFFPALKSKTNQSLPLFISTYGANPKRPESFFMGAKTLWRAIHEFSAEAELHPHLLRHTYALELLKSSNDIRLVSQALGHSDIKITMRYTERKDQEVAEALEQARKKS